MKSKGYILIGILIVFSSLIAFFDFSGRKTTGNPVPGSCTIFSASVGDKVLFGNNEDYNTPTTYYWTEPADNENYGAVYLGFENYSYQGGINEKGLCFDANALPDSKINPHSELTPPPTNKPPYEKYTIWAPVLMLRKATTVEEAIKIAGKYQSRNWYPESGDLNYQINLADAKGDAVVISVDKSGELAFTRKKKGDTFLVSTNFNRANTENAFDYPCKRYNKATGMLERLNKGEALSVDYFKSILAATHVEGIFTNTLYSNIYDLKKGIIYLYYRHQFDEVAVLKVNEELAKGKIRVSLKDLFSHETVGKASKAYKEYIFLMCFGLIVGIGIIIAFIVYFKKYKRNVAAGRNVYNS
jgi:hypothetical protein